ncbi:hypothetical protein [Halorubrum tebenquichense]|uniref:hypothetical protein n=1 Tax=Halorubrum tebenquichense TaxID=119434 RepID=UPI001268E9B2|nr:hypothetical protein [Halorubrum tebenquichense]
MERRNFLLTSTATLPLIAGCQQLRSENPSIESTISIENRLCDGSGDEVEIVHLSNKNIIRLNGIIEDINGGSNISSTVYGPSDERKVIYRIFATESTTSENNCDGSVEYISEISYDNIEIQEVIIIHGTGSDQKVISSKSLAKN